MRLREQAVGCWAWAAASGPISKQDRAVCLSENRWRCSCAWPHFGMSLC